MPGPIRERVRGVLEKLRVVDMHTHLFPTELGPLWLSGIDELLTYHYLLAEHFRSDGVAPEAFFALPKSEQADRVWRTLFVEATPISEATSGLVAILTAFGLDPKASDLREARAFFASRDPAEHLSRVLDLAGVSSVVMTNDPWDPVEAPLWLSGARPDSRFRAALRLDRILNEQPGVERSLAEVRRTLDEWTDRMAPEYAAVSLPEEFRYPDDSPRSRLLAGAVLPHCKERGLPFALMLGARRQANPRLRLAGDALGRADLRSLERLARDHEENRFFATVLSREDQHELCVIARKFANVMPFGCWWFCNNPSIATEVTRERLEMLGLGFIPQHSDARVLEQLVYKWRHAREVAGDALALSYAQLEANGRAVSDAELERDAARLFAGNFERWAPSSRAT